MFSHSQESRAPSHIMVTWEDTHHNSEHLALFFPLSFYCWAWHHTVWNILLVSWGQLSWFYPIPDSFEPHWQGKARSRKDLACVSTAQQQLEHQCVINSICTQIRNTAPCEKLWVNPIPSQINSTIYTNWIFEFVQGADLLAWFNKAMHT